MEHKTYEEYMKEQYAAYEEHLAERKEARNEIAKAYYWERKEFCKEKRMERYNEFEKKRIQTKRIAMKAEEIEHLIPGLLEFIDYIKTTTQPIRDIALYLIDDMALTPDPRRKK